MKYQHVCKQFAAWYITICSFISAVPFSEHLFNSHFTRQVEQMGGGPLLHGLRRISELPSLPPAVLKSLDWQLRKDLAEVERASRAQADHQMWLSNNRLISLYLVFFFILQIC